ncbi:MAG: hypothetical protein RIR99_873 [Actinomycetota bacterium]|jgi:hypothetical protein
MTSSADDAKSAQNPGDDEKDLIDEKFNALVSGLSLYQSTPNTYLDELERFADDERFTPPQPPRFTVKKFFADGIRAVKKWKDNPRPDNSGLDDDGAQV